ncbi:hypothetical protein ACFSTC_07920 [Nonomuraea ferruginea]
MVIIWQFTSLWNDFLFAVFLTGPQSWLSHGDAEQHRRRPGHPLQPADGRGHPGVDPDHAHLCAARPVLHARPDG